MAHSWITAAALLGFELHIATPKGFSPQVAIVNEARQKHHAKIFVLSDPKEAVRGAHVVTTDVWSSMGQEQNADARKRAFAGFTVDESLFKAAASDAIFLHCLPAHRGEEVAAAVIDGPRSRVWQEAENRLHTQKALLERLVC